MTQSSQKIFSDYFENPFCIFCFQLKTKIKYSLEHIIPSNIKGNLTLPNSVCVDCNSWLGNKVDSEVLRLTDIAKAFQELGYDKDYKNVLKKNYEFKGVKSDGTELKMRYIDGDIVPTQQKLPDGTELIPEIDAPKSILRKILRKNQRNDEQISENEISAKFDEFLERYKLAKIDEEVVSSELEYSGIKRSEIIHTKIKPKKEASIFPLLVKICYEISFLFCGLKLFEKNNEKTVISILNLISGNYENYHERIDAGIKLITTNDIQFLKETPCFEEFKKFHIVTIENAGGDSIFHVSFFGKIQYMVLIPQIAEGIFESFMNFSNLKDVDTIRIYMDFQENFIHIKYRKTNCSKFCEWETD